MQQKDVETQKFPMYTESGDISLFFDDNDEKKFCVKFNSEQQNSFHDGMTVAGVELAVPKLIF